MKMRNVALAKCVFVVFSLCYILFQVILMFFYGFSLSNCNSTEPNQIE